MIQKDKHEITGILSIPFSKYYNAAPSYKKRISQKELNSMMNRLFITLKNSTQSGFMELDKNYQLSSYVLPIYISKLKSITNATNYSRYVLYIHNEKLYGFNIYTDINYEIEYSDYSTRTDMRIGTLMNEITRDKVDIGGLCVNNNCLLFVFNSDTNIYIVSSFVSYTTNSIKLSDIKVIKTVRKDYIKHLYGINTNIVSVTFHNNYLFLLSSEQNMGNILYIKWYKNFNTIGNRVFLTEMKIDGTPIAIGVPDKFVLIYSDVSNYVKFFETDIKNIV